MGSKMLKEEWLQMNWVLWDKRVVHVIELLDISGSFVL